MTTATDILQAAGITTESTAPGRHYATCPKCSAKRKKAHQKLQCLGVTIDGRGVKWGCNHCRWKGGEYFERSDGSRSDRKGIAATYPYVDESGTLLFEVIRYEPKSFKQRRPNGGGGWTWKLGDTRRVLYRLPELIEAIALKHPILIVEGEKDVDRLRDLGLAATCNPGGANKWHSDFDEVFRGADVVLIPDDDEVGWQHINAVGARLKGIVARVRVLRLPNAKDTSVWIEAGGTREQLDQLIEGAPDWVEPATVDNTGDKIKATTQEDELIEALARMPPGIEFARQRKKVAKELGVNRSALDDEIDARRSNHEKEAAPLHGHWIAEPWPEVVDGDSLLRDIIKRIRRHVITSDDYALTIALWIMLAWVHDEVATHSPILNITSAEPESGKSTTLGLIAFLAPRCIASVEISEAALYRAIKLWQPSFAVDEFDSVLASDDKTALRSVINSGHTKGQGVVRCIGDEKTPELFPTFCPKAVGMCGRKMPAVTLSRCIFIEMRRKKSSEPIERFLHKDDAGLAELRSRLTRWVVDNEDALRGAEPSMPTELTNRRADNWRLQFAIADLCLADWGDRARAAALKIEGKADSRTLGARLLYDIKRVFDTDGGYCMHSAMLVAKLIEDPEKPWAEFTRGKPLTQGRLARLLGTYQIFSQTVSPPGLKDGKGYYRSQFEDAWELYASSPVDGDSSSSAS